MTALVITQFLKFLLDRDVSESEIKLITDISRSYFSDSIQIEVLSNAFAHDKKRKLKDFESYI